STNMRDTRHTPRSRARPPGTLPPSCLATLASALTPMLLFFFTAPAPTEIYTLSLHDALPIYPKEGRSPKSRSSKCGLGIELRARSEEHTSELQSPYDIVCRLLLEKKKSPQLVHTPLPLARTQKITLATLARHGHTPSAPLSSF